MRYTTKLSAVFKKSFKRLSKKYRSIEDDVDKLITQLETNPTLGTDLGGGIRKVRMAITSKGRGKSGGARVITYTMEVDEEAGVITLLTIYDKSEQNSITQKEISEIIGTLD